MSPKLLLKQAGEILLDFLFPPHCAGCGREGRFICQSCLESLPRIEPPYCERCGTPLASVGPCPGCDRSPLSIDGIRSLFLFEGAARQAVHSLKYRNIKALAHPLGQLLAQYLNHHALPAQVLVPVPLHRQRLRQRGYNQAALLAQELGRQTGLPMQEGALLRLRNAPAQAKANAAAERVDNVRGAFRCSSPVLQGKQALLIDDVCTTGATLNACAVALKEAGAASVWGLTVAREA